MFPRSGHDGRWALSGGSTKIASGLPVADLVLVGGDVVTMDSERTSSVGTTARAVAVTGGRIAAVGADHEIRELLGPRTRVIQLHGRTLLPGFIDAHDHFAMAAIGKLGVDLSGIVGKDAILAKVREYVAQHKDAKVLRGFGWYPGSFRGESPRREWLDEITGDVPMVVCSADIHDLWFNTAAMNAAGLTAATPDPEKNQYFADTARRFRTLRDAGRLVLFTDYLPAEEVTAVRCACGALLPGGVSVGTRTRACRKRTSSSKCASIQASSWA